MTLTYQEESVLNLLRYHLRSQRVAIESIESKARHNFTVINIIAAILATVNQDFQDITNVQDTIAQRPLLIVIFLSYIVVVVLSILALLVRAQATEPMKVTQQNVSDWAASELGHHYDILTKSYVQIYTANQRVVNGKGRLVLVSQLLIAFVILCVLIDTFDALNLIRRLAES